MGSRSLQRNTLEGRFCREALDEALARGRPEIFNTDQGSQFASREYTGRREETGVVVSRDGRARALGNLFVERLGCPRNSGTPSSGLTALFA
jgi:putative transposase